MTVRPLLYEDLVNFPEVLTDLQDLVFNVDEEGWILFQIDIHGIE